MVTKKVVWIVHDVGWDEYRVPGKNPKNPKQVYHTEDKRDAITTARAIHGKDVEIRFKSGRQI